MRGLPVHRNVARLVEVMDDPMCEKLYLVMEYAGKPLEPGTLSERECLNVLTQALEGLAFLHAHGVVHGDLKVEHLLRHDNGRIRIVDFGSSEAFGGGGKRTGGDDDDLMVRSPGTAAYTAPECCTGQRYHGRKADVWALGMALYVLRYGIFPFRSSSADDMYEEIRQTRIIAFPSPLESHEESQESKILSLALRKMLEANPSARPSADQVLRDLLSNENKDKTEEVSAVPSHISIISTSNVNEIEEAFVRSMGKKK